MALLEIKDVHYKYVSGANTTNALNGVSLEFDNGKIYAITGRSGCGKTTLLSLISGFDDAASGEIIFNGERISKRSEKYRRNNVGIVFQSYNLIKHLSVLDNILLAEELSSIPKKERKKRAVEAVLKVGLTEKHLKKKPNQLSGGEQQRVAVARVLACEPQLILADEPTGNLDDSNSEIIVSLLSDIAHSDNKCVIMVTHSEKIAQGADVWVKMADGKNQ